MMCAQLIYGNDFLKIADFSYAKQDAELGSPYNTSFELHVYSGVFSGVAPCEYNMEEFRRFVLEMRDLYQFGRNTVELQDIGYGSRVEFRLDKAGHLMVSGKIFGEAKEHAMEFTFSADQTAIGPFVAELENLMEKSS